MGKKSKYKHKDEKKHKKRRKSSSSDSDNESKYASKHKHREASEIKRLKPLPYAEAEAGPSSTAASDRRYSKGHHEDKINFKRERIEYKSRNHEVKTERRSSRRRSDTDELHQSEDELQHHRQNDFKSRNQEHRSSRKQSDSEEPGSEDERDHRQGSHMDEEEFPWLEHRYSLNKMFFRDNDLIKRGSQEYDEFWVFLKKYQKLRQNRGQSNEIDSSNRKGNLNLPSVYKREDKINFYISGSENIDDLMVQGCIFKDDSSDQLSKERVSEFASILHLYIDFLQRQKFSQLRKLRTSQSNLPIANYCESIVRAVKNHQVILVAGDTGCGKSTQVPQYLLAAGFSKIACTQPRRIACIALCKRVAFETLNEYGTEVGYQIRFEKSKTKHSRIIFLTEGLLLRQVSTDPLLSTYDVLILDEVHERHLSCDFLLGVVKCLIHQRKDLKIVLMSATINIKLFSEYFSNCPTIQVPGRLYPIQVTYQPIPMIEKGSGSSKINVGPYVRILHQIDNKYSAEERGDLLIFLSGITEITAISEAAKLYADKTKRWIILPLHSTLSLAEQDKVFDYAPEGTRKCIVSTNIAETSVTIDGVRFVVDSGKVKEMSFDTTCRMQRLKEFWISKASAEQRKGRAGRTGPGICFRLYSQTDYEELAAYSTPEIQRVPLDSTLLQMIAMGLPDARLFPFLEAPPPDAIEESLHGLKTQGALNDSETLTPMGQMLSRLPVDVTFGKMLIQGSVFQQLEAVLVLAAAMSVQSPFTNRSYRDLEVMAARKNLESDHGDPFTLLNAYHDWATMKAERNYDTRKWCKRNGLEEQRFYEMTKLIRQFRDLLQDSKLLEQKQSEASSSNERMQRYGELMKLRDIKKQLRRAPRKRKYLKVDGGIDGIEFGDESEHDDSLDVHDIDFRISNDKKQIKELSSSSKAGTYDSLALLKTILCSGLYPQIAIPDEHNPYKSESEQLYHTKDKPFVAIHPMGCFALKPDLLKLREMDCVTYPGFVSRYPLSMKHQLLCYVSLLETTKPYLMNCMQVPAAHTLLLLAHNMDTNSNLTHVICDQWMELCFPDSEDAQQFVAQAIVIRDLWQKFLETVFKMSQDNDTETVAIETRSLRKKLTKFIGQFHQMEILHTVRRLLAADLKDAYVGPDSVFNAVSDVLGINSETINDYEKHSLKGGLIVREYLTYNCLVETDFDQPEKGKKSWICPGCEEEFVCSVLEQVRHREKCVVLNKAEVEATTSSTSTKRLQRYFCHDCRKELNLSATDILRHKKSHANAAKN